MKASEQASLISHFSNELALLSEILFQKSYFEFETAAHQQATQKDASSEALTHTPKGVHTIHR